MSLSKGTVTLVLFAPYSSRKKDASDDTSDAKGKRFVLMGAITVDLVV